MYGCPNCGANLKFDIARQMLFCEYCDTAVDPYSVSKEKDAEERTVSAGYAEDNEYEVTVFTCPQCGGQILSEDNTAATFCSFCGAATILDSRISREKKPASIITFKKTREDCVKSYKKMMKRAFFAPKELMDEKHIEKFRGIYMPYWVYSFEKREQVTFPGRKTHRRGDYRITKHYDLSSDVDLKYSGMSYDASSSFSDNLSSAIAPFDMQDSKTFTPSFLSGFYADSGDVDSDVYIDEARDVVSYDSGMKLMKYHECRKYNVNADDIGYRLRPECTEKQIAMLPVWFLSYRNGERVTYSVINGQTGKAAADLPVDFKKYLAGSMLLAVPIFILLNLLWTITPIKILVVAALLALLSAVISNRQSNTIFTRENEMNDKGLASVQPLSESFDKARDMQKRFKKVNKSVNYSSAISNLITALISVFCIMSLILIMSYVVVYANVIMIMNNIRFNLVGMVILILALTIGGNWLVLKLFSGGSSSKRRVVKEVLYRAPFKEKLPTLIKPFAGIGLAVIILLINPAEDLFYYFGAVICMAMVIWSFRDLIEHHNMLTTRKLPQLGKRGGDENA